MATYPVGLVILHGRCYQLDGEFIVADFCLVARVCHVLLDLYCCASLIAFHFGFWAARRRHQPVVTSLVDAICDCVASPAGTASGIFGR